MAKPFDSPRLFTDEFFTKPRPQSTGIVSITTTTGATGAKTGTEGRATTGAGVNPTED